MLSWKKEMKTTNSCGRAFSLSKEQVVDVSTIGLYPRELLFSVQHKKGVRYCVLFARHMSKLNAGKVTAVGLCH